MAMVLAAIVTGIFAIIVARQGKKTNEIHRQVTVNHHSSTNPTILDLLSDVLAAQDRTNERIDNHLEWHLEDNK